MKKITLFTLLLISLIPLTFKPGSVFAEDIIKLTSTGAVLPYGSILVTVTSKSVDLSAADITWLVDQEEIATGKGHVRQKINIGAAGNPMDIEVRAIINGEKYSTRMPILPGMIDIVWQAQTITPPFFRGKALPTHNSPIRLLGVPFYNKAYLNEPISYIWREGIDTKVGAGLGVNTTQILAAWENESKNISLDTDFNGQKMRAEVNIPSIPLQAYFYRISPTRGVETNIALPNNYLYNGVELSILFTPYGLSQTDRAKSKILHDWRVNGKSIVHGTDNLHERITLSRQNDKAASGTIYIEKATQNTINVMQYGIAKLSWIFNEKR